MFAVLETSSSNGLPRCLSSLSFPWDKAQLSQHAQLIRVFPDFHNLAINDAVGGGTRKRHRFAGGRHVPPRPLVGAAKGVADHDLLPFSNQVLNCKLAWQSGLEASGELFVVLAAAKATCGIMADEVGDEYLLQGRQNSVTFPRLPTSMKRRMSALFSSMDIKVNPFCCVLLPFRVAFVQARFYPGCPCVHQGNVAAILDEQPSLTAHHRPRAIPA